MSKKLYGTAAVLAAIIGLMAVVAGAQVLLGRDPGYYVIGWLPVYNFILGLVSLFGAGILLARRSRFAFVVSGLVFGAHAFVMVMLQTIYRDVVALDSIVAMSIRLIVWGVILGLVFAARRKDGAKTAAG